MQWGVTIPMRDGVTLSATLYLPVNYREVSPAIFTLTPYIGQTYHDRGMYFATHGYPFLTVDSRGRGNSEGTFKPFLQEAQDGHDVVEWLAQQSYCDGKVAMWGGSYGGYDQWATAKEFPPHLATIVPVAAPYMGVDVPMRNNIFAPYLMQWLTLVSGRASQEKIFYENQPFWRAKYREWFESGHSFASLDSHIGNSSTVFREWVDQPCPGDYWDRYNPTAADYAKITLPTLTITGIYDADQPGALAHYREHLKHASAEARQRHYLIIGPWDHPGTRTPRAEFGGIKIGDAGLLDMGLLHRQWYGWTMRGGPKPPILEKHVAYYVMGAEKWRHAGSLESITAKSEPFYLDSKGDASRLFASGMLRDSIGEGSVDGYVYDPLDIGIAAIEFGLDDPVLCRPTLPLDNLRDQILVYAKEGKQIVYHSEPFGSVEISGFFRLTAWLSIDQPDTDFEVCVYEVSLDGSSLLLAADSLRARYRESLRTEKLVDTEDPLEYRFERFTFVSRQIATGSRLRLVIGPVHSIYAQKNYNNGGVVSEESMKDARTVVVRLYHSERYPSVLHVPFALQES